MLQQMRPNARLVLSNDQLARLPPGPPLRTARVVNHRQDMNEIAANRVEDTVQKPRKEDATNAGDYLGIQRGSLLKTSHLQFDRGQELFAKAKALRFVPLARFTHFTQRPSRKLQAERHVPFRRWDLTCSHE